MSYSLSIRAQYQMGLSFHYTTLLTNESDEHNENFRFPNASSAGNEYSLQYLLILIIHLPFAFLLLPFLLRCTLILLLPLYKYHLEFFLGLLQSQLPLLSILRLHLWLFSFAVLVLLR